MLAKTSAVMRKREPDSASLNIWSWPTFRDWRSLLLMAKQQAFAAIGRPGVIGDSGR